MDAPDQSVVATLQGLPTAQPASAPQVLRSMVIAGSASAAARLSPSRVAARSAKAVLDVVIAGTALLLLAPTLVVIAMLVRATSPGPALFRQTRVGRNGRLFTIVKFRTMHVAAENDLVALVERNESSGGVLFKIRHDPRVTPVGRLLRRLSLDELPQLFNVLAGSMSLVGPRPQLPAEAAQLPVEHRRRHDVRPGLTGLWQVSGRSRLGWQEAIELDLRYVDDWSFGLDMALLARTVRAVLTADGAY